MFCETKISKGFQTVVPAEIRKDFNLGPGDVLLWKKVNEKIEIQYRKRVSIDDILGVWNGPKTNAVEIKKRIQRGEKC